MKKSLISLVMIVTLVFLMLSGCGNVNTEVTSDHSNVSASVNDTDEEASKNNTEADVTTSDDEEYVDDSNDEVTLADVKNVVEGAVAVVGGIAAAKEIIDDVTGEVSREDDFEIVEGTHVKFSEVEKYNDKVTPYIEVHHNKPFFKRREIKKARKKVFEDYSKLDKYGRCGVAYANLCEELRPTEERGDIGNIKPSGWKTSKYNDIIDGNYLYNRCHLIAFMLAGENDNEKNLITGTRYLNNWGMLPFEEKVNSYLSDNPDNHVLYRVTPVFKDDELVARGVLMEAYSVEDKGKGVKFCVYCYNVQPGIVIDYSDGDNGLDSDYTGEYAN